MDETNFHPQHEYQRQVLERLNELVMVGQQNLVKQDAILKAIQALAPQTTETIGVVMLPPVPIKEK